MKKQLLIEILQHAYSNQLSKSINDLLLQIAVDPELGDDITIDSFSNEFYSVRSIRWLKQIITFRII